MHFLNPPIQAPPNIIHRTFNSQLIGHEMGYNILLPPEYENGGHYPVAYHLHGWQGNESSDIWAMERIYKNQKVIAVFPNNSHDIEDRKNLPIESMIINELIPHIDHTYRTTATREGRSVSGFSMGGGMAFCYALKYPDVFSAVTVYAGTFHHYFNDGYDGFGETAEKAAELYEEMMRTEKYLEENHLLHLIRQSAERIRGKLQIDIRVGTTDILFCENEIIHRYLNALNIPHEYKIFLGVDHELGALLCE